MRLEAVANAKAAAFRVANRIVASRANGRSIEIAKTRSARAAAAATAFFVAL